MPGVLPVDRLYHVSVVVRDLEATARNYATVYGIERWEVAGYGAERLRDTSAFGFETRYTYATATGSNAHGVTFRLVQPTGGFSTYSEFLVTRGEGIHGICVSELSEARFMEARERLREFGVAVGQAVTVDGAGRHYHLDTRRALGGYYLEVVVPAAGESTGADEVWDFSGQVERPPGVEPLQDLPRIGHFGVAVDDLMGTLPAYASLLGLTEWTFVHFRPEPGWLEHATLNGQEVRHAFLLAIAGAGDVAFEVLQQTVGPTHYRQEFIDRIGVGIHHLLLLPALDEEQGPALRRWLESLGAPVVTSGVVRHGAAEYVYLDTRRMLGGYLVEAITRRSRPDGGLASRGEPDYRFDFSRRAVW